MKILQSLCSTPTAPFAETRVADYVTQFVQRNNALSVKRDRFGNILIQLKSRSRSRLPRWVFTAHIDHPGFVAGKMVKPTTLQAAFHGWVTDQFVKNAKVRFFEGQREIPGVVVGMTVENYEQRPVPHDVRINVNEPVSPGSPGMFDQGEGRFKSGKFFSRVCDDLAGAAACLEMIEQLSKKPPKSPVAVLLTRAEEEGFIGCVAACQHRTLLKKTDRVIAIECSAVQPYAPQGKGVIIRVGDRASIFNSALTYFLGQQADELKKIDRSFSYQRALMPGGTCEATVYDIWGYTAASLCVPLGNYHNMDTQSGKIGPEFIDVSDWNNMVKLFVRLAQYGHEFDGTHGVLRDRILARFKRLAPLLA